MINIPSFYRDFAGAQQGEDDFKSTARDVLAALKDFEKQGGVDAVVIDLRGNGGGALQEAIEVTGLFVDQGPVVLVKEQNGKIRSNDDTQSGVAYGGPLIVLCNRLSASASEIFAGAIKDYQRGIVIGDHTTHGKGTVQNVMPVSSQMFRLLNNQNRGALKLTINQFYRVNGDSTQNRGVESDIALPSILDHMDLGESFLDNALAFDRINPAPHVMYDVVSQGIVAGLRDASQKRVAADAEFAKIQKDIQRYLERKTRKFVWLNEEKLRSERDADKAANEAEKEEEERETKRPRVRSIPRPPTTTKSCGSASTTSTCSARARPPPSNRRRSKSRNLRGRGPLPRPRSLFPRQKLPISSCCRAELSYTTRFASAGVHATPGGPFGCSPAVSQRMERSCSLFLVFNDLPPDCASHSPRLSWQVVVSHSRPWLPTLAQAWLNRLPSLPIPWPSNCLEIPPN